VPRILIADHDAATRAFYCQSFVGCDVLEAVDGRDALTIALVRPPSLVITEIDLPLIDGVALCSILRSDRMTADVPILVVTSEHREKPLQRIRLAGADSVLAKPQDLPVVVEEARRLLALSNGVRQRAARARARVPGQLKQSANLLMRSKLQQQRPVLAKLHQRFTTTTPPAVPPPQACPSCGLALRYEYSHIGGVNAKHAEQWDYYTCAAGCGTFQFRQRTRKLRHLK